MTEWKTQTNTKPMPTVKVTYQGDLSTRVTHQTSGTTLNTDAPKDHAGKGRSFAPTDLLASSIGAASITYLAIRFEELGWEFPELATAEVEKVIAKEGPRRIGELNIKMSLPGLEPRRRSEAQWMILQNPAVLSVKGAINVNYTWQ